MAPTLNDLRHDPRLDALVTERLVLFPIRHHSPVCARYLECWMRDRRPDSVLVEGPSNFTPLIPLLLHPRARTPFAIYTRCHEAPAAESGGSDTSGTAARAAYFPFCDGSPELVALRVGAEIGATCRFIDLDYAAQVRAEAREAAAPRRVRADSLLAERHFAGSPLLQGIARRVGCRDVHELWDHLFESRLTRSDGAADPDPETVRGFIREVAAWCLGARDEASPERLAADGTTAREAAMAAAVRAELAKGSHSVLVVTGGFHAVALPDLVARGAPPGLPGPTSSPSEVAEASPCLLIPYGFPQLDALNGYAAGMPSPLFYDRLWRAARDGRSGRAGNGPPSEVVTEFLVEIGRQTRRERRGVVLSLADEIAASGQCWRLAILRGHAAPMREDLLDAIRSCFVKGALDAEGSVVMGIAHRVLGGEARGAVPAEAGTPPLVADFTTTAKALRLRVHGTGRRRAELDLYRRARHRRASRFFHCLAFLDVTFATLVDGPDFENGTGLERLFEHWEHAWTPQTEGSLIEASIDGDTIEEAAANRLLRAVTGLEETATGRSAIRAVRFLVGACRMGLHGHAGRLLEHIGVQADADPDLASVVGGLGQLRLLWEAREPLEAHALDAIPGLMRRLHGRAVYLSHHLADVPEAAARALLDALLDLRDLLRSPSAARLGLDATLFHEPLLAALGDVRCAGLLAGGACGWLHHEGRITDADVAGYLVGAVGGGPPARGSPTDFLIGLLRSARELAWRLPALLEAVDGLIASWDDEEFLRRLPHLRLAFGDLTPTETDRVARQVAGRLGMETLGRVHRPEMTEREALDFAAIDEHVRRALTEDGLDDWIAPQVRRPDTP